MLRRFTPILILVALCWLVFVINNLIWPGRFDQNGVIPRHLASLPGIIWAPFLHGSFQHLVANTLPLLILGGIICARSRAEFAMIALAGTLLTGSLTWIFARNASHIGASGLVFCLFGYVASQAYFRHTFGALVLSAVCVLAYGGMLKGVFPSSTPISWESHVAGLVSGIVLAWFASKLNPPDKDEEVKSDELVETLEK
jgi:membrane associated rhomboid family serine protease